MGPPAGEARLFFSEEADARRVTRSFLEACGDTLRIVMYKFSDKKIARRLEKLLRRGIVVQLLLDGEALLEELEAPWMGLVGRGLEVRLWPPGARKLHAKFAVDAEAGALLGSANWTPGGMGRNAEILLWSREEALRLELERIFRSLWVRARPLGLAGERRP
jgi:phosphatidylserine/phosphatidylglycerophosphate/cardiolipin synthase-like enzyme